MPITVYYLIEFWLPVSFLSMLLFKVLINLSANTSLHSLCVEYIKISLPSNHFYMKLLHNYFLWSTHNLFDLCLNSFTISVKSWTTVSAFLSFKGLTHAYLMKTSITHNKYLALHLIEDNDLISFHNSDARTPSNLVQTFLLIF